MNILLYLATCLTLLACAGPDKKNQATNTNPVERPAATSLAPPVNALPNTPTPTPSGSVTSWQYTKTVDNEGREVSKASVTSPDLLEFDFPYAGGSTATLTLRRRAGTTHVYIQVSKGQFNRSYQGGQASVRFDGGSPVSYAFSAAENGSASVIFFDSEQALINRLKAADKMVVIVEFEGQGNRQITFRTAGLRWP